MQFIQNTKWLLVVSVVALAIIGFYLYGLFTKPKPLVPVKIKYPTSERFVFKNLKYGKHPLNQYDLYLPADRNDKTPILVLIHGGAWVMGDKSDFMDEWAEEFCDDDIIVANMNYRLLDNGVNYTGMMQDIHELLFTLKQNAGTYSMSAYNYNLLGSSAGGHLALLYAYSVKNAYNIHSVISLAGPTNLNDDEFKKLTENGWGMQGLYNKLLGEEFVKDSRAAISASPIYHIKNIPTLLVHATDDDVVPFSQSKQLDDSLQHKEIKHRLFNLHNGKHSPFGLNNSFEGIVIQMIKKMINEK